MRTNAGTFCELRHNPGREQVPQTGGRRAGIMRPGNQAPRLSADRDGTYCPFSGMGVSGSISTTAELPFFAARIFAVRPKMSVRSGSAP